MKIIMAILAIMLLAVTVGAEEIYIGDTPPTHPRTTITTEENWVVERSFVGPDVILNVTEPTLTIYLDAIINYKEITQITITKDGKTVTLTPDELWERVK
jgi:hypothetical protein